MILIVDDHEDTRVALVQILALEGYAAHAVSNAIDALAYLTESPAPRLIILDYNMPDMNGLELNAQLKVNPRLAAVPVIMFSAHGTNALRADALKAGVSSYVTKASLDWMGLQREVVRLAGPPNLTTQVPLPPDSGACDIA